MAIPLAIALGYMGYMEFYEYGNFGLWIFLPLAGIVILLISNGYIDYWWQQRHPIPLDDHEVEILEKFVPYYQNLNDSRKQIFQDRLSIYINAREWKNVGAKDLVGIPDDIKTIIASQGIQLTFHQKDYLIGDFDRIYTYKHPFQSPKYQFLHTLETNQEDGMIILSMEHALPGVTNSDQYYNIVMHAYADAYVKQFPGKPYPEVESIPWDDIHKITGFTGDQILKVLGFSSIDPLPLLINLFFTCRDKMAEIMPAEYRQLQRVFPVE